MRSPTESSSASTDSEGAAVPRDEEHPRGLHEIDSTVVSLVRPSSHTLRVCLRLQSSAEDPEWARTNPAFRIYPRDRGAAVSRVYTVRRFWPQEAKVEFDVVLHGADSPMTRWAAGVKVGDALRLTGPRVNVTIPMANGRPVALFADDAALPALYSVLQHWPNGTTGVGWIASDDLHALGELPRIPGLQLHQIPLIRSPADALLRQARQLPNPGGHVVWGAGERDEMRAIRHHFQTTVGLAKKDVAIAGYWKRGTSNTEIDAHRMAAYQTFIAAGGTLADWDDLAVPI